MANLEQDQEARRIAAEYISRDLERIRAVVCKMSNAEVSLERMKYYSGPLCVPSVEVIGGLVHAAQTGGTTTRIEIPLLQAPIPSNLSEDEIADVAVGFLRIHVSKTGTTYKACLYDVIANF